MSNLDHKHRPTNIVDAISRLHYELRNAGVETMPLIVLEAEAFDRLEQATMAELVNVTSYDSKGGFNSFFLLHGIRFVKLG